MKTYIYEVYEQLHRIPANLVIPVGNGTLYFGAIFALEELLASGVIDTMPQIIAVQSEHCDPLLRAAETGASSPVQLTPTPTLAEGIAIGRPMRGEEILRLAKKHGVRFIHAPEDGIIPARADLAAKGIYAEHTAAANYAAYRRYCTVYGETEDCLIVMCGAGLKSDH
jgi:threonine synthase